VTVVRFDVVVLARFGMAETVGIRQVMWFVMLESAKDQVIGVDTQDNRCHHMSDMEWLAY
jgi:hypothetical protein